MSKWFAVFAISVSFACLASERHSSSFAQDDAKSKRVPVKKTQADDKDKIQALIRELNAPKFETREKAQLRLKKFGNPALQALRKLNYGDATPQTIYRANNVIKAIEEFNAGYIDLSKSINHQMAERFGRFEGNTLENLPRGVRKMGGVSFKIADGVLMLGGKHRTDRPKKIENIKIQRTCRQIHFLHAVQYGSGIKDKTKIGEYVVHYSDGKRETIPIVMGVDVRDWWNTDDSKKVERGKVVWTGSNKSTKSAGCTLRLFSGVWKNPRPDQAITKIDFVQTHDVAAPFCVAITVKPR